MACVDHETCARTTQSGIAREVVIALHTAVLPRAHDEPVVLVLFFGALAVCGMEFLPPP